MPAAGTLAVYAGASVVITKRSPTNAIGPSQRTNNRLRAPTNLYGKAVRVRHTVAASIIAFDNVIVARRHALGHHLQPKAVAQGDDAHHQGGLVGGGADLAHERLVDLDLRDGQVVEVVEVAEADAEVVHRAAHAQLHELLEGAEGGLAALQGEAVWDRGAERFTSFELLATGLRQGTNQYNNRSDDLGPAPMGIAFQLAGSAPRHRTPPHQIWHRGYWG